MAATFVEPQHSDPNFPEYEVYFNGTWVGSVQVDGGGEWSSTDANGRGAHGANKRPLRSSTRDRAADVLAQRAGIDPSER